MIDLTSAFVGLSTPVQSLYQQIADAGWEIRSVKSANEDGRYIVRAKARNPHGEEVEKFGPDDRTALANLLVAIHRHTHLRTAAQHKVGMWQHDWTDQLQPIAEAYKRAPVYDPKAAAAWKELADDSMARFRELQKQLHIEVTDDPEPYASAKEMTDDIHGKQHFWVSRANSEHPVWTPEQNVAFRAVHDVLGHAVSGGGFDWHGENAACRAHFPLLSPNAQRALFTECIAQTGYANHFRGFGPQKVAFLDEFLTPAQQRENPPGHMGVHPSQIVVPTKMPEFTPGGNSEEIGNPWGTVAPHMEGLGLTPVMDHVPGAVWSKTAAGESYADPNAGWTSNIEPMATNGYLWHGDPLQGQEVMDNASKVDTGWSQAQRGDGSPDTDRMKQAIVNAFRVVLLSPRKDLRWNAIHYQDISHVPASTDDPKVYWDTLESRRRVWNEAQGIDPNAHMPYYKFLKPFQAIIYQKNPTIGFKNALEKAQRILFDWWSEEQERLELEDERKPPEKQRPADELERRANEALARRLKQYIKDSFDPKTDVEEPGVSQNMLFEAAGQYNLLTGQEGLKYGAFMGTHLKAIAQISQHADDLLKAAMEDVQNHDGSGHHFRAATLSLGISGVGPKVCSFAWLLLQPMTSQLATIDTHMMDVLGHHYEKEMNNRDYFKFERELAAGRDASGYSHIPLGAFQWGMWDFKRTGEGSHQDHSAMRVLDPVPHQNVDWVGKATNLKGDSWLDVAPQWWQETQPARDAVAQDWDTKIAPNFAQNAIPYQAVANSPELPALAAKTADGHLPGQTTGYWFRTKDGEKFIVPSNLSVMQHAKSLLGLPTMAVWQAIDDAGSNDDGGDGGE
jgi:hypothetical protein